MGWTNVQTTGSAGEIYDHWYLTLPGFGRSAAATFTKYNAAEAMFAGDIIAYVYRDSSGERWSRSNTTGMTFVVNALVCETNSASGATTVSARRVKMVNGRLVTQMPGEAHNHTLANDNFKFYGRIIFVTKTGAETWAVGNTIYGYVDGTGATLYTKTLATANAPGHLRWRVGEAAGVSPVSSSLWAVAEVIYQGALANDQYSLVAPSGTFVALPVGSALQQPIFSNYSGSTYSLSYSSTTPIARGVPRAITGSGSGITGIVSELGGHKLDACTAAITMDPPGSLIGVGGGGSVSGHTDLDTLYRVLTIPTTFVGWSGSTPCFNTLIIHLPIFKTFDPDTQSNPKFGRILDFACDVTLPAPIGDCRIVWANGQPMICARTDYGTQPVTGMVLNDVIRSEYSQEGASGTDGGQIIYPSEREGLCYCIGLPYQPSYVVNLADECYPTSAYYTVYGGVPGTVNTDTVLIAWWYRTNPGSTVWVQASVIAALSWTGHTSTYPLWTGSPPGVSGLPADMKQNMLALRVQVNGGSWAPFNGFEIYGVGTGQLTLPVYPYSTTLPGWVTADSDIAPVYNAGWIDPTRAISGTFVISGTPTATWNAGTNTFDIDITPCSCTPSATQTMVDIVNSPVRGPATIKQLQFEWFGFIGGSGGWSRRAVGGGAFSASYKVKPGVANVCTLVITVGFEGYTSFGGSVYVQKQFVLTATIP